VTEGGAVQQSWLNPNASVASAGARSRDLAAAIPAGTTSPVSVVTSSTAELDTLDEAWRTHSLDRRPVVHGEHAAVRSPIS
jgi:hypothetical protein